MNIEDASTENKSDLNKNSTICAHPSEKGRNTKAICLLYKLTSHSNGTNENELNEIKKIQSGGDMNKLMNWRKQIAEGNKEVYIGYENRIQ